MIARTLLVLLLFLPVVEALPTERLVYRDELVNLGLADPRPLFDVDARLLLQKVVQGENVLATITLINFGDPGNVDVTLQYTITGRNIVFDEKETVAVDTQLEFLKAFDTSEFGEGDYRLAVNATYKGQKAPAVTEAHFKVRKPLPNMTYPIALTTLVVLLFVYERWRRRFHK